MHIFSFNSVKAIGILYTVFQETELDIMYIIWFQLETV